MQVVREDPNPFTFKNVPVGDAFCTSSTSSVFMRIVHFSGYNAVNLHTGTLNAFSDNEIVVKVEAKVIAKIIRS